MTKKQKTRVAMGGLTTVVCMASAYIFSLRAPNASSGGTAVMATLVTAGTDAGYVESNQCAGCHQKIWDTYRRTGMGRSFARIRPDNIAQQLAKGSFYHEPSEQYYSTYEKDGKYYQRRHQIGFEGKETNIVEKEIHFVVGSGNHVRTYLHKTPEGKIFELPGGWYAEGGGFWGMNPGYDRPDNDNFRRQINGQCVFCHTGYPEIERGADRTGTPPLFVGVIPEGIDCQRCHGPGRAHIEATKAPNASRESIHRTIVNPARLSSELQMDVCMQCHLETTSVRLPPSIVRYSRGMFSFRTGERLADYILHFDHSPGTGYDDKFEIAGSAYRLRKSACFIQSAGALQCTTCHNPHDIPRGADAERHYTAVCVNCHSAGLKRLVAANRHTASQGCVGCHMPKRRSDDVVHAIMTDHFIQRRKPVRDLLAPLAERREDVYKGELVLYYPKQPDTEIEMYLAVAQVRRGVNLKDGIPRLEKAIQNGHPKEGAFYFELAEAYWKNQQTDKAIETYETALQRSLNFLPAIRAFGVALAKSGRLDRAAETIERALGNMPNDPTLLSDLGLVYLSQGKASEAVNALRKSLDMDPDLADAHNNLGGALSTLGDATGAEAAYRNAIRVQPDLAGANKNLAGLLARKDNFAEAEYFYRKAIRSDPTFFAARYDFGIALAQQDRFRDAAEQFEAAVRLNPRHAEAQSSLGDMLALSGSKPKAIEHYRRALALNPDLQAAREGLQALR